MTANETKETDIDEDLHPYLFTKPHGMTRCAMDRPSADPSLSRRHASRPKYYSAGDEDQYNYVALPVSSERRHYNKSFEQDSHDNSVFRSAIEQYLNQDRTVAPDADCYEYFSSRYGTRIPRPRTPLELVGSGSVDRRTSHFCLFIALTLTSCYLQPVMWDRQVFYWIVFFWVPLGAFLYLSVASFCARGLLVPIVKFS